MIKRFYQDIVRRFRYSELVFNHWPYTSVDNHGGNKNFMTDEMFEKVYDSLMMNLTKKIFNTDQAYRMALPVGDLWVANAYYGWRFYPRENIDKPFLFTLKQKEKLSNPVYFASHRMNKDNKILKEDKRYQEIPKREAYQQFLNDNPGWLI